MVANTDARPRPRRSQCGIKKSTVLKKKPPDEEKCPKPNMLCPGFQAAVAAARFTRAKLYSTMPTHEELNSAEALQLLGVINNLLESISGLFQRTWKKMLRKAFPELEGMDLPNMLQNLVVRCWMLRRILFSQNGLHDFVEFCAGQGNLSMECVHLRLFGAAMDVDYSPDHNMMTATGLRVMIDCISKSKVAALNWWGTKCSSHVPACAVHHKRKAENGYWGDESLEWVRDGNLQQVPHYMKDDKLALAASPAGK